MKKIISIFIVALVLGFASHGLASTVTINFDNVFGSGVLVGSMQMNFLGEFPFLSDDDDPFAPSDFSTAAGDAITWHSAMISNWYIEALEDYNDSTGIADASGLGVYSGSDSTAFALHDGTVVTMTSSVTFSVDLGSLQIFDFVHTATPIAGLNFSESFSGDDQVVTVSTVPIPGAIWLLGSGFLGLVTIRRRRRAKG